jgi:hypothetical protein
VVRLNNRAAAGFAKRMNPRESTMTIPSARLSMIARRRFQESPAPESPPLALFDCMDVSVMRAGRSFARVLLSSLSSIFLALPMQLASLIMPALASGRSMLQAPFTRYGLLGRTFCPSIC